MYFSNSICFYWKVTGFTNRPMIYGYGLYAYQFRIIYSVMYELYTFFWLLIKLFYCIDLFICLVLFMLLTHVSFNYLICYCILFTKICNPRRDIMSYAIIIIIIMRIVNFDIVFTVRIHYYTFTSTQCLE